MQFKIKNDANARLSFTSKDGQELAVLETDDGSVHLFVVLRKDGAIYFDICESLEHWREALDRLSRLNPFAPHGAD